RMQDVLPPSTVALLDEKLAATHRDGVFRTFEYELPIDNQTRSYEGRLGRLPSGRLVLLVRDITRRVQAQQALRRREAEFASILSHIPGAVYRTGPPPGFQPSFISAGIEELTGYSVEHFLDRHEPSFLDLIVAEDRHVYLEGIPAAVDRRQPYLLEYRIRQRDGAVIHIQDRGQGLFDAQGRCTGTEGVNFDITQRKLLEQEFLQAQKMEAIGQLAGGVAHDFNNLLQAIVGHTTLALADLPPGSDAAQHMDKVQLAAERAARLTRHLLAYSRRQLLQREALDPEHLIRESLDLLKRMLGERIEIDFHCRGEIPVIEADPSQVEQILFNLCINARDAMPEGGTIRVELAGEEVSATRGTELGLDAAGNYLRLSIADTGVGMDREVLARIYEPFFTTKPPGSGTGLGLSMVYGSLRQHGGVIHASSQPRKGSRFDLYFPAATQHVRPAGQHLATPESPNTATILVAEDDPLVSTLMTDILEAAGHRVLCARDGRQALEVFDEHAETVDLAILDLVMPHLGGPEVLEKMRERRPGLAGILVTGYAPSTNDDSEWILNKPFTAERLREAVRLGLLRATTDHR
ncbi:MAG TPA: PAS domain-containing hybrid sensor histidine kinase/response regulator, partial [Acidobacteria bacterium]|nr:PAS domain-containing hybrid sensor histidine kinase/response regulator [Acidobacteriota bacterium]